MKIYINGIDTEYQEININKSIRTFCDNFSCLIIGKEFDYKIDDKILIKNENMIMFEGVIESIEQIISSKEGSIIIGGRSKQWLFADYTISETKQFKQGTPLKNIISSYGFEVKGAGENYINEDIVFMVGDNLLENCRNIAIQDDYFLIDSGVVEIAKQGNKGKARNNLDYYKSVEIVKTKQFDKYTTFGTSNYRFEKHKYNMSKSFGDGKYTKTVINKNSEYSKTSKGLTNRGVRLSEILTFTINEDLFFDVNQVATNTQNNKSMNVCEVITKINQDTYYQKVSCENLV